MRWLDERATEFADDGRTPFDWCHQSWATTTRTTSARRRFGGYTLQRAYSIRAKTLILAPALDLYNPASRRVRRAK